MSAGVCTHFLLNTILDVLQLLDDLAAGLLARRLLATDAVELGAEGISPLSARTTLLVWCNLLPDGVLAHRQSMRNEASRSRGMACTRTYQLKLKSVDLSLDFVLFRIVERLVGLARTVHDIRELVDLGGGDSGTGGARGRGGFGLLGRAVSGSRLRLGCHSEGEGALGSGRMGGGGGCAREVCPA